jgi:hypothetical protein
VQLELTQGQAMVHDTAVRFVETELPLAATRALHDEPLGYDRAWLRPSADLDGVLVPAADSPTSASVVAHGGFGAPRRAGEAPARTLGIRHIRRTP